MHAATVYLHKEVVGPKESQAGETEVSVARYKSVPISWYTGASKCALLSIDASPTSIGQHMVSDLSWPGI